MLGNQMVSFSDYDGIDGYGSVGQQEVDDLNKALTAGQDISAPSAAAGEGFPLRVESLENTLKTVTFTAKEIVFWKAIPKIPAYNTVEEHNQISSYGANEDAGFIVEGALPESDDSTYERKYAVVKFLGTTRAVTHVMSLVRPAHGNVIANETVNGTLHLLRILEKALYYGSSALSAVQFDGFLKLITDNADSDHVLDLRGAPLTEDIISDAVSTVRTSYGFPTNLHLNHKTKSELVKTFFPKERHNTFTDKNGVIGTDVTGFTSESGTVQFTSNTFLIGNTASPNAALIGDATKIPGYPAIATITPTGTDAPLFTADDAGDYYYSVAACNRYGRSVSIAYGSPTAVTVAATEHVPIPVTPSTTGGAGATEWYEVYRTKKNGASGTQKLILRVKNTEGTGAQTIIDYNASLPDTTNALLLQQNLESLSFKQLAPMVKIPLATIATSVRWCQVLYGVPVLYAPNKNFIFNNVGRNNY
jgi:hypothetical protein